MPRPERIRITEVGARDGLQNEAAPVPTQVKAAFVRALVDAGLTDIEVSSFVRPDLVPQLADAAALFEQLGRPPEGVTYSALVPNSRGLEGAVAARVGKIAVFTAASETFNQKNIRASIAESIERFRPVVEGKPEDVALRGYVSCAVACPYEGPIAPAQVADVCQQLLDLGCDEISVGDTIGAGTPASVNRMLDAVQPVVENNQLVLHFHDTRGMAIANVLAGLERGIYLYDASAAGLGGCPFAPGASGNLATEDLVFLCREEGIETGVDLQKLRAAGAIVAPHLGHPLVGRVFQAPMLPGSPA